jgi:ATP-dependent DNA ligase
MPGAQRRWRVYRACRRQSCRPTRKTTQSSLLPPIASAYLLPAMKINPFPAGFVVPAQPVKARKPLAGIDWLHEIKHDGYKIIVRRDGPTVRLYSRNAYDWTVRLAALAATAELIKELHDRRRGGCARA